MLQNFAEQQLWYAEDQSSLRRRELVPEEPIGTSLEIPAWWGSVLQRIAFLLDLQDDWDSYGAKRIDRQVAYHSVQILQQIAVPGIPAPSIVPTVRGYLQFEWHIYGIDLEFEVMSPVLIGVAYEDSVTGNEWETELDYNLTPLSNVLKNLLSRTEDYEKAT